MQEKSILKLRVKEHMFKFQIFLKISQQFVLSSYFARVSHYIALLWQYKFKSCILSIPFYINDQCKTYLSPTVYYRLLHFYKCRLQTVVWCQHKKLHIPCFGVSGHILTASKIKKFPYSIIVHPWSRCSSAVHTFIVANYMKINILRL